jgi:ABC-type transport system involved in multi-copper enzyme maturation permease subunit
MNALTVTLARHTLLETVRTKLLWLPVIWIGIASLLRQFIGELTLTDTTLYQTTLTLFFLRLGAICITALVVTGSVIRDINDKQHELILATPITRHHFFIGKLSGYCLVSLIITFLISLPVMFWATQPSAALFWCLSLLAETCLIATLSLVLSLVFGHFSIATLITGGCYLLSRTMGALIMMGDAPHLQEAASHRFVFHFLSLLDYLVPNLDRFTQSDWLISPPDGMYVLGLTLQALLFMLILSMIGMIDLSRKNV